MPCRIVDISQNGRFLAKSSGFLLISEKKEEIGRVPLDDIGVLMVSAYGATITKEALVAIADRGGISILCGSDGKPSAFVTPFANNFEAAHRYHLQVTASKPLMKRLWQRIVRAKIAMQASVLSTKGADAISRKLTGYLREVESGDPRNREAVAARLYWKAFMGESFRRDPDGAWPNDLLNYGYAILRASMLRAICSSGLLPEFGIHHGNQTNPTPLADDLMEVYRPVIDTYVSTCIAQGSSSVTPKEKQEVSKAIWADLECNGMTTSLQNALQTMAESLVASYKAKKDCLVIPMLPRVLTPTVNCGHGRLMLIS